MSKTEIFAKNLCKSGYGDDYKVVIEILSKLTESEIDVLAYNCYRTAEKVGKDAFDCVEEFQY